MICIVIPTYNEAGNVEELTEKIFLVEKELDDDLNILFVDDDSNDGTLDIIYDLMDEYGEKVDLIHRENERGLGSAYVRGFKEALESDAKLIFGMDADLSQDPADIPKFVDKIDEGFDVVQGSRYIEGGGVDWGIHRQLMSWAANTFAISVLDLPLKDVSLSYKAYKPEVLEEIGLDNIISDSFSFFEEILYRAKLKGFRLGEVPTFFKEREYGKSKMPKMEAFKFFITILKLRFFVR